MADGLVEATEVGTPQGSILSPLLSTVYLHYVLDIWVSGSSETKTYGTDIKGRVHGKKCPLPSSSVYGKDAEKSFRLSKDFRTLFSPTAPLCSESCRT